MGGGDISLNPRMHEGGQNRPQGLLFFNIFKIKSLNIFIFQVFLIKHVCDMRPFAFLSFLSLILRNCSFCITTPLFHEGGQNRPQLKSMYFCNKRLALTRNSAILLPSNVISTLKHSHDLGLFSANRDKLELLKPRPLCPLNACSSCHILLSHFSLTCNSDIILRSNVISTSSCFICHCNIWYKHRAQLHIQ